MTPDQLKILLQEGEGTMLEYKESLSASFARELVALANTLGGRILLGVRDDGSVIGINDSNELRARVQDIARNCDPPVQVLVEPVGKVLVVTVRESAAKPVQCRDGFFTAIFRPNPDVRAQVGAHDEAHEAHAEVRSGPSRGPVGAQSEQVLNALRQTPLAMKELVTVLGLRSKTGALKRTVNELLSGNWIEYTIPAKPKSRLQKYRITPLGAEILKQ